MTNEIPELLQQIRQVENEHNQLVDEYFKMSMWKIKDFNSFMLKKEKCEIKILIYSFQKIM